MNFLLSVRTNSEKWNYWVNLNTPPTVFQKTAPVWLTLGAHLATYSPAPSPLFLILYNLRHCTIWKVSYFSLHLLVILWSNCTSSSRPLTFFFFNCWNSVPLVLKILRTWHFYSFYCKASLKMIIFKTCKNKSYLITTLSIMLSSPAIVSIFIESHVLKGTK